MSGGTWLVRLMLILIYTQLQATVTTHYQVVMMMIVDIMALSFIIISLSQRKIPFNCETYLIFGQYISRSRSFKNLTEIILC